MQAQLFYNQRPEFLKANAVWAFGDSSGIDFNNGVPVGINTSIAPMEGGASICDTATGELLFYAGGGKCYNRNHEVMPNGDTLYGGGYTMLPNNQLLNIGGTTAQGDCIVPVIDSPGKYYLFSLNYQGGSPGLRYSIVDMELDNGLGDIVPGGKNVLLDGSSLSEAMVAIPGNNCDIWLVVHEFTGPVFKAYHITREGLHPDPVVSSTGSQIGGIYMIGRMAVAPNRNMVAFAVYGSQFITMLPPHSVGLLLCKFDTGTGVFSNGTLLSSEQALNVCFSPDNAKLYAGYGYLLQYDVSGFLSGAAIPNPVFVTGINTLLSPKLYKDTIYLSNPSGLSRICSPNLTGADCDLQYDFLTLGSGGGWLPSDVVYPLPPDTLGEKLLDTLVCTHNQSGWSLQLTIPLGYKDYTWSDGAPDTNRTVTERGTYWLRYKDDCHTYVDTFIVRGADAAFDLGSDTTLCSRPELLLDATVPDAESYYWQDGAAGSSYTAREEGHYWVEVRKSGCVFVDAVNLDFIRVKQDLGEDLSVCRGEAIELKVSALTPDGGTVLWSTGSSQADLYIRDTGTYWITVTQPPCTGSDTIRVLPELCDCYIQIPNAFSPNGDGLNDVFQPVIEPDCLVRGFQLQVFNRWGQLIYQSPVSSGVASGWDGRHKGQPADAGTYIYRFWMEAGTGSTIRQEQGEVLLLR